MDERLKQIATSFAEEGCSDAVYPAHLFRALLHKDLGLVKFIETTLDKDYYYLIDWAEIQMGLALSIASPIGIDDKAFLHVQGSMKEMDVALYKWFKNSPDAKVTIGRSVDCNFQITWDIGNDIAARVAMINVKRMFLY